MFKPVANNNICVANNNIWPNSDKICCKSMAKLPFMVKYAGNAHLKHTFEISGSDSTQQQQNGNKTGQ